MKQINFLKTGNVLALKNSFRSFMAVIMLLLVSLQANAQEEKEIKMYVAVQNNTVATFYYDNLYDDRNNDETEIWDVAVLGDRGLSEKKETIEKVVFDASFSDARPTSTYEWFYYCFKLNEIIGIENLNTSNVTNMGNMFYACSSLHTIDVSKFDTSNVWGMSGMFAECYGLTSLDLSNFDTSNVTDMSLMFYRCANLESLDVSNFNTSNVWSMERMFASCELLSTFDLSSFDTSNVRNMSEMFNGCMFLYRLDLSNFNTKNVTDMCYMFNRCPSLFELNLSNFDTSNVIDMGAMFAGCESLTTLDVSSFDTSNVTNMSYMFADCSSLTTLDVSNFDTKNVRTMAWMFSDCHELEKLDVSNFNTSNVESMADMFVRCIWLGNLDVSNFDTSNVTDMRQMFYGCAQQYYLDLSHFNTSNVRDMSGMFRYCRNLTILNVSSFDTSNVTNMEEMFCGCNYLKDIDLSSFDTSNVTDMWHMFGVDSGEYLSLESITIGEKITRMPSFAECSQIKKVVSLQKEPYAFNPECFSDEVKENAKLLVPIKTVSLYADTEGWKEFKNILTKELDPEEENSGMGTDNIDENTDLYGNIVNNVYFNIAEGAGKYIEDEGCIVLTQAMTNWNIDNSIGKDLFDEDLLEYFTGMIFMLDAGSGTISIEAETIGEMELGVKIGNDEPVIRKTDGKDMVTIDYSVAEPTMVYIYGWMSPASYAPGMRKENAEDNALKIYSIAWDKTTGIGNIQGATDSGTAIFNLNGQRVNTPGKGVYIVNGKKVILK